MKPTLLLTISLLITMISWGQESNTIIKGKVTEKGEALIGVTIMIEETTIGTFTDLDGNFKLDAFRFEGESISIRFQYAGYKTAQVHFDSVEDAAATFIEVNYKKPKKFKVIQTPK
ncbi:carboxypeptidase-like regulatory domain-containing protein [Crocinitomicaceae bacterium]|nr:carboxypeptidase-like regulatory domain-containing protein [Crocinitomicaceae bacterium]